MNLYQLRKSKNLTQKEIASVLNLNTMTYNGYENENREPSIETLIKLANYFDTSLDYLVGRNYNNGVGNITNDEKELITDYRQLNEINKIKILAELKGFLIAQN